VAPDSKDRLTLIFNAWNIPLLVVNEKEKNLYDFLFSNKSLGPSLSDPCF
jgi:hypothetical protein